MPFSLFLLNRAKKVTVLLSTKMPVLLISLFGHFFRLPLILSFQMFSMFSLKKVLLETHEIILCLKDQGPTAPSEVTGGGWGGTVSVQPCNAVHLGCIQVFRQRQNTWLQHVGADGLLFRAVKTKES